ncbi:conserved hypothetical protein [Ricinus communis]|uniref:Uncharacterized protein n=1 Tax=Ricinus communis TaxID=3988 RepID=B9T6R8_RICCO|nr:conserved hypothetical protein [Ricinus communis]
MGHHHQEFNTQNLTLIEAALRVLTTPDLFEKVKLGDSFASQWLQGTISHPYFPSLNLIIPYRPSRFTNVKLIAPGLMPKLEKASLQK